EIVRERGAAAPETDEHEAGEALDLDRRQVEVGAVEILVLVEERHAGEAAVELKGPGMIGTHDARAAVAVPAVEEARGAVAADVVEGAHLAVLAAHDEGALAIDLEAAPVAALGNVVEVADEVPGGEEYLLPLERHEIGIEVGPGGQRPGVL